MERERERESERHRERRPAAGGAAASSTDSHPLPFKEGRIKKISKTFTRNAKALNVVDAPYSLESV